MENNLTVFGDEAALELAAATLALDLAKAAVLQSGRFTMVLSGGHTPQGLYRQLAKPPFCEEMPWDKTFIFWGDERCVPADDADNNAHLAASLFLNRVPIPAENIFRIDTGKRPEEAAFAYEKTIRNFFASARPCFDLVLLGLGENGHTASLFPGTAALAEHDKLVTEVFVPELNSFRITMTAKLINDAANIVFLVTGGEKAAILEKVLSGPGEPEKFPAQLIHPSNGNLRWMVDAAAASLLPKHT